MSTPIAKLRTRRIAENRDCDEANDRVEADHVEADHDEADHDDRSDDPSDAVDEESDDDDDYERVNPVVSARGGRSNGGSRRARITRATRDGRAAAIWKAVFSVPFAQAVFLAFAAILCVSLTPVASFVINRVPVVARLPRAESVVCALVSALLVTAFHPPLPL